MRVFHFMEKKYAIENIKRSRIKVATLANMNDPYEFYLRLDGANDSEITRFKSHYNDRAGFLCFSRRLGDPVQWAHYADNHRGICFEFDIPERLLLKIIYIASPKIISAFSKEWKHELVDATLCKYKGWRYERERRVLVDLQSEGVEHEDGLFFAKFSKDIVPLKVYMGVRCVLNDDDETLFNDFGLPVIKMNQDRDSFAIVHA